MKRTTPRGKREYLRLAAKRERTGAQGKETKIIVSARGKDRLRKNDHHLATHDAQKEAARALLGKTSDTVCCKC